MFVRVPVVHENVVQIDLSVHRENFTVIHFNNLVEFDDFNLIFIELFSVETKCPSEVAIRLPAMVIDRAKMILGNFDS